jgi:ribonuclease HII
MGRMRAAAGPHPGMAAPPLPDLPAERIAGVDEAGRGCLAGPVVAAAVILPAATDLPGLTDSKLLSPARRDRLAGLIRVQAVAWGIAAVEASEIDATNILRATLQAMALAVGRLDRQPSLVLVDGNTCPPLEIPARAIVKGDLLVAAISAASILAKVTRDRLMEDWAHRFPRYGFEQHKGYGTAEHRARVARFGPCPIHRMSFAGVREHAGRPTQGSLW